MREPKLAAEIAKQLRKFHQVDIPGSKEPQLWNDIFKFYGKGLYMGCYTSISIFYFLKVFAHLKALCLSSLVFGHV